MPSLPWHLTKPQVAQLQGLNELPSNYQHRGPTFTSSTQHPAVITARTSTMTVLRQVLSDFLPSFQQALETGTGLCPFHRWGNCEVLLGA